MLWIFKVTLMAGGLAVALGITALAAQEQTPGTQPEAGQPGMMQGEGMMPMMGMMQQMSEMMAACTKMMQAQAAAPAPMTPPAQPENQQ